MNKCSQHPDYDPVNEPITFVEWEDRSDVDPAITKGCSGCLGCWQVYAHNLEKRIEALSDIIRGMAKYSKTVLEGSFKKALEGK